MAGRLTVLPSYQLKYLQMANEELVQENRHLQDALNRLEESNKRLHAHIQLQRAEIIVLQNRNEKSAELKGIFEQPKLVVADKKYPKMFTIDNRNEDQKQ